MPVSGTKYYLYEVFLMLSTNSPYIKFAFLRLLNLKVKEKHGSNFVYLHLNIIQILLDNLKNEIYTL